jgi:peptide/nickel transport system permease protein
MSRWRYFATRVVLSIPVVLFGTSLTFLFIRVGPIDPAAAILGQGASAQEIQQLRRQLGLTQPLWQQYFDFMSNLITFNVGDSWVIRPGQDAMDVILALAPRTLWLGFWAVLLPLFIGIPFGFYAGLHSNTMKDYLTSVSGIVWRSVPAFWLAILVLMVISNSEQYLGFNWEQFLVPTKTIGPPRLNHLFDIENFVAAVKVILPASLVLGSASLGNELRIGRTAIMEHKNSQYVEMAKAKGLSGRKIVWKHMFRNALIPLVPVIVAELSLLVGGSVLVEVVFGINGLGWLFFNAMLNGDIPLAGTLMYLFILLLVFANILQDFLYTIIDPRVGYEGR